MNVLRRVYAAVLFVAGSIGSTSLAFAAPAAPEDIRDIRAPFAFPPWWRWPLAIALAALAALAVVLLVRAVRAWQKRRAAKTPLDRARAALLVAEEHARAGRVHAWAEIVAETLRGGLAARLGMDVLPKTTSELARAPWAKPPAVEDEKTPRAVPFLAEAPRLLELLAVCDLARFARANVNTETLVAETRAARDLAEKLFAPRPPLRTPPLLSTPVTP